ncbi:MAG: magnesium/cobalt transporter CorA [Candidatus Omnitrophica bacterium]|nr:magnesium/cobalt transporter CorA [Candidatus Omnitrophota bacterium]
MPRFTRKLSKTVKFSSPANMAAENINAPGKITVIDYDEATVREKTVASVEECFPFKNTATVTWINVDGGGRTEAIEKLGQYFNVHPLVMEGIAGAGQRPKFEDFEDYLFLVLKMLGYDEAQSEIREEQVSIIIGKNFVMSFQGEQDGDVFDSLRERIRTGKGRLRKLGADYLGYALVDAIVDHYFLILEKFGEHIETIEEQLIVNPGPAIMQKIYHLKRELIFLRKSVWPLREVISGLERCESGIIKKTTRTYLRDVYAHTIQVIDTIETFRDMVSGMLDLYLSSISNKMNEIMKVLTTFASIFIPLTFMAGVYGMNFKYMPELEWRWGYYAVLAAMVFVGGGLFFYFKKRKWL